MNHSFPSIEMTDKPQYSILEIHDCSPDSRDWLSQVIKFTEKDWPNYNEEVLNAYTRNVSRWGVSGCVEGRAQVGAKLSFDGERLIIVPCCKHHATEGVLDAMGHRFTRLKSYQCFVPIPLEPGSVVERDDKFFLTRPVPNLID